MRIQLRNSKVKFYIGDVRNINSVNMAMQDIDYVFHAAALKQVPSCEFYPMEAVYTNILGTENVLNSAILNGIKKVVCLSTDKAVYPINAMGISKAMMEKVMVAKARMTPRNGTIFTGTRYGNVMGSRGSVIPLFIKQIRDGIPITITDPNMTRFLMSLDDAVDLVLHAFTNGGQGNIFIQKAPASTVMDLALALKELFSATNEIQIIGTRHGEKLYETLLTREEITSAEDEGDYFKITPDDRDLNYSKYFTEGLMDVSLNSDYTSHNTRRLNVAEIKIELLKLDLIQHEINLHKSNQGIM